MMNSAISNSLFLIPARGGSKGIPKKNTRPLGGKPLLHYSIEYARQFTGDQNICVSSDDPTIIACANALTLDVPFVRPSELASDTSGSFGVMHHALQHYQAIGKTFEYLVLLQPTSPFRLKNHLQEAFGRLSSETDVVVSAYESPLNPYYNLYEVKPDGFARISKGDAGFLRRQDVPPVYAFNGSLYIFRVEPLLKANGFGDLNNIAVYAMDHKYAHDLDTPEDWLLLEFLYEKGHFSDSHPG